MDKDNAKKLLDLLDFTVNNRASDLHLSAGLPPMFRIDGELKLFDDPALEHSDVLGMLESIMNEQQLKEYQERLETDLSFENAQLARFRVNAYTQERGAAAVFRVIPANVISLEELGLPPIFTELASFPQGLVLVTGPTGSGKSTTLAAMVDYVNKTRNQHIITIEDPIEFIHQSKKCLVNQREVHRDTESFSVALRSALREDPDVILVGELRDLETIGNPPLYNRS